MKKKTTIRWQKLTDPQALAAGNPALITSEFGPKQSIHEITQTNTKKNR